MSQGVRTSSMLHVELVKAAAGCYVAMLPIADDDDDSNASCAGVLERL